MTVQSDLEKKELLLTLSSNILNALLDGQTKKRARRY